MLPEKKDHDKFFKKIAKYLQSKGGKNGLDRMLEMAQKGNLSSFLNGQGNILGELQDDKDLNFDWIDSNDRAQLGGRNIIKRMPADYINAELSNDEILKGKCNISHSL